MEKNSERFDTAWVRKRLKRDAKIMSAYRHKADINFGKSEIAHLMSAFGPKADVILQV